MVNQRIVRLTVRDRQQILDYFNNRHKITSPTPAFYETFNEFKTPYGVVRFWR